MRRSTDCPVNAKKMIGAWGKNDVEEKLERCANEVKLDSECSATFFYRADKGRCFCELVGAPCDREQDSLIHEYRTV